MKKWFLRMILAPVLLVIGFSMEPTLTVAAGNGATYDAASKTYYNVATYRDLKKAVTASNTHGGNYTVYVTGDIIFEQIITITNPIHFVSEGGKHVLTTNGYGEDYGNSFRVDGSGGWVVFDNFVFTNGAGRPVFQVFSGASIGRLELNGCDFYGSVCPVCLETTSIGKITNCTFSGGTQGVVFREGRGSIVNCSFSDYNAGVLVTCDIGLSPGGDYYDDPEERNIRVENCSFSGCRDAGIITYHTDVISSKAYVAGNSFDNCRNGVVINNNEAEVYNNHVTNCYQIGIDCIRSTMTLSANTVENCPVGVKVKDGTMAYMDGTVLNCTEYGAYIEGNFIQKAGSISGTRSVYQDGSYQVSSTATTLGDVYLVSPIRYVEVTGPLSGDSRFVIDCADKSAGNVLAKVTYASGATAESLCRSMIGTRFFLSLDIDNGSSSYKTVKTADGVYHRALLRAGRGDQSTSVENPECISGGFSNGEKGTLILSCELTVSYDTSEFAGIRELQYLFVGANGGAEALHQSRAVYGEGFSSSDGTFLAEWSTYHNDTDGRMEIDSLVNSLKVGTAYTSAYEKNTSFVFLGWCRDVKGYGDYYVTPTSFPAAYDYTWYPIFDVQYDLIYDANFFNESRSEIGGVLCMSVGEKELQCKNSKEDFNTVNPEEYCYISPWEEVGKLCGNTGPATQTGAATKAYFKKSVEVEDFDNRAKVYQKEAQAKEYTYRYSYQGWSLNSLAKYSDRANPLLTQKVFYEGEALSTSGASRTDYKNRRDLVKACASNLIFSEQRLRIKLYLVWDEAPVIWSYDVSFTSGRVRDFGEDGFLQELLKEVDDDAKEGMYRWDFEDEKDLTLSVVDYDYARFLAIGDWSETGGKDEDEFEIVLRAQDKAGNTTDYPIMAHITSEQTVRSETASAESAIYYRFVSFENWIKNPYWKQVLGDEGIKNFSEEELKSLCVGYVNWISEEKNQRSAQKAYEAGAMEPYSKWYIDPALVYEIGESFL